MEDFRSAFDGFVDWELPTAKALWEGFVSDWTFQLCYESSLCL